VEALVHLAWRSRHCPRVAHVWGPGRIDEAVASTGHETTSPVRGWASSAAWRGDWLSALTRSCEET